MVHYIRFLRPPQCDASKKGVEISAVVALQTDLSDALLDQDVVLIANVLEANYPNGPLHSQLLHWQAALRVLKFTILCPSRYISKSVRLHMTTKETESASKQLAISNILDVWSCEFRLSDKQRSEPFVERRTPLPNKTNVRIIEEIGESMARHIWDASVGFLMFFTQAFSPSPPSGTTTFSALARPNEVRRLRVLELGAGCGIVGIALAQLVKCDMYITDLEEAQHVLAKNIKCASPVTGSSIRAGVLDWTLGLDDSSNYTFDLILVSDCIYNPDSSVHLVEILRQLATRAPDILILVGFKRRHETDTIFFDRMRATDFELVQTINLPLPHSPTEPDSDTPTAEFYTYKHRSVTHDKG